MIIDILSFLIGLYIVIECIDAASGMHKGDRPCRMVKYLLAGTAGMILILYQSNWQHLVFGLAIAAFTWPDLVNRFKRLMKCRCEAKTIGCMAMKVVRDCPLDHTKCDEDSK